jgi:hypothetical protein
MGDGGPTIFHHGHALAVFAVSGDRMIHRHFFICEMAPGRRHVSPSHLSP